MENPNPAAPSGPRLQATPPSAARAPGQPPAWLPAAGPASARKRHYLLALSFGLWVVVPLLAAAIYLFAVAQDQYASRVGFSVRTEEAGSAIELLGGITELSGSSSSDTDILYEFIQSQQMVRAVNDRLDLRAIYAVPGDPLFSLGADARIEAMSDYWARMVKVAYDPASGLIEVRVLAFDPQDAQNVALAIFDESSKMINQLSRIAREDTTRYAQEELDLSIERLKAARQAITAFRNRTQIVDPSADIQGQMGLLNSLQAKLADAIIERALLLETTSANDPRVAQARRKIDVIREQIEQERAQFGGASQDQVFSSLLEEYEGLQVDREFAEQSFISAQAARDAAVAEAQRQSRYLASYITPTLAETAEYPRSFVLLGLAAAFLSISWSIGAMVYYSLRDRR